MEWLNVWLNKFERVLGYISAGTIFVMMIWIFLDVTLRFFFNQPITGTLEITGEYILPVIVYCSISYTHQHNGHVNVDLLFRKFSRSAKRILGLISNVLALVVFILLSFYNFQKGMQYFSMDIRSVGLIKYPLAPALMIISIGILTLSIRLLFDLINILRNNKEFN